MLEALLAEYVCHLLKSSISQVNTKSDWDDLIKLIRESWDYMLKEAASPAIPVGWMIAGMYKQGIHKCSLCLVVCVWLSSCISFIN